jgi:hypothetical protein
MKTNIVLSVLLLMVFLLVSHAAYAQKESGNLLKNGDFEKFTGDNPDNWENSNIPGTLTVVSPSKTCHAGARAVKCEVKEFYGSVVAGYVCQKSIPTEGKDLHLSGYFLVRSVERDLGVVVLCFQNSGGSTVGTVEEYLDDSKSKFLEFTKEIKSPANASSVHVRLTVLPGKESEKLHPGSYVICDDLKLVTIAPKEKPPVQ